MATFPPTGHVWAWTCLFSLTDCFKVRKRPACCSLSHDGDATSAEVQPCTPPSGGCHGRHIFTRRPSGASPPICCNDYAAGSRLLDNGCQSSKERLKNTFQFSFLPFSSVHTFALFFRGDVCFRPRVFCWMDVF